MYRKLRERANAKWALVSLSVLFGTLVLLGSGAVLLSVTNAESEVMQSGYLTKNEIAVKNYDIAYPVFRTEQLDTQLRNFALHRLDSFWNELSGDGDDPRNFLRINYTTLYYGTRTATITFSEQRQFAGRSAISTETTMTFDVKSGKRLSLAELFADEEAGRALLARIVHDYFQQAVPQELSPAELEQLNSLTLQSIPGFALGEEMLALYMNPRKFDSSKRLQTIAINKDLLASVLHQVYLPRDTTRIQNLPQPNYAIRKMPPHVVPVDPSGKLLALTFDDGPGNLTPQVLDMLGRYGARGTFFVIGRQIPGHPGIVKRMVEEGHEIGNHTWDHPDLTSLPLPGLQEQIEKTQQVVQQAANGYTPRLLRPPKGIYNDGVSAFATGRGLKTVLWNVDTSDWRDRNAEVVYQRIMAGARDGAVILLHDIHPTSVEAMSRAVPELVAQGYQLVTLSELYQYR